MNCTKPYRLRLSLRRSPWEAELCRDVVTRYREKENKKRQERELRSEEWRWILFGLGSIVAILLLGIVLVK
jgi:hypothetical protein